MATTAGAPPGSGKNFAALKGKLAARGAHNPGALAAWIGRRKYGRKGFAKLSAKGRSSSHSNPARGLEFSRRMPVRDSSDLLLSRSPSGSAVIRHRRGGGTIGELRHNDDGTWQPVVDGASLTPYRHQRTALLEMLGAYNRTALSPERAAQPLVPAPVQTPLMARFGIPAASANLANGGPDSDGDSDAGGDSAGSLNPRGKSIYQKLKARGMADKIALAMARRAQNGPPGRKAA